MEGSTLTDRTAVKAALVGKDYIETIDWTVEELEEVVAVSMELKAERKAGKSHLLLPQKTLYMLFLGNATASTAACGSTGTPGGGGSTGPRVPTLVQ